MTYGDQHNLHVGNNATASSGECFNTFIPPTNNTGTAEYARPLQVTITLHRAICIKPLQPF